MSMYGSLVLAETYFTARLHVLAWEESTDADKTKALNEATARIDRLHFRGNQVADDQDLEFPRFYGDEADGTETTPNDILIANYECAYALLDGVDPEFELENLAAIGQGISSARSTYAEGIAPEHTAAGIPSAYAWRFLKPYLGQTDTIKLRRVS